MEIVNGVNYGVAVRAGRMVSGGAVLGVLGTCLSAQ